MPAAPSAMMAVVTMVATMTMVTIAMLTTMAASARAVPQAERNGRAKIIRHARIGWRPVRIRIRRIAGVSRLINSTSSQRGCDHQRKNQAFCCAFDMHSHGRQLDTIRFHNDWIVMRFFQFGKITSCYNTSDARAGSLVRYGITARRSKRRGQSKKGYPMNWVAFDFPAVFWCRLPVSNWPPDDYKSLLLNLFCPLSR